MALMSVINLCSNTAVLYKMLFTPFPHPTSNFSYSKYLKLTYIFEVNVWKHAFNVHKNR